MRLYRSQRAQARTATLLDKYYVHGFLAAGTYGSVYKATVKGTGSEGEKARLVAIKKFKPEKEGDTKGPLYTGISQSACREIMVGGCRAMSIHADYNLLLESPAQPRTLSRQSSCIV